MEAEGEGWDPVKLAKAPSPPPFQPSVHFVAAFLF